MAWTISRTIDIDILDLREIVCMEKRRGEEKETLVYIFRCVFLPFAWVRLVAKIRNNWFVKCEPLTNKPLLRANVCCAPRTCVCVHGYHMSVSYAYENAQPHAHS